MADRQLRRAGLDYHEYASVRVHADWHSCLGVLNGQRLFALTTRSGTSVFATRFQKMAAFIFGSETAGLPENIFNSFQPEARLRLPMRPGNRSLNLSNAVAVTVFEALRQLGFPGG